MQLPDDAARAAVAAHPSAERLVRTRNPIGAKIPLTSLDEAAAKTEGEFLALHGVRPKAVRILKETLADRGMSLA